MCAFFLSYSNMSHTFSCILQKNAEHAQRLMAIHVSRPYRSNTAQQQQQQRAGGLAFLIPMRPGLCRREQITVYVGHGINVCFLFCLRQFADSPEIRGRPGNVEADIGSNVTLRCDVDGNPEPEISWTYEGSRRVLSTGPAYTFWMNHDMAGKYSCTARVPGFPEVSEDAHVFLKGDVAIGISLLPSRHDNTERFPFPFRPQAHPLLGAKGSNSAWRATRYGSNASFRPFPVHPKLRGLIAATKLIPVCLFDATCLVCQNY